MFSPSCSPHDPNLMFVGCDMGGVYRSEDGGRSWSMLDKRQLRNAKDCPLQFHVADAAIVYAPSGGQLLISRNAGRSFSRAIEDPPWGHQTITAFTVDPASDSTLLVGAGGVIHVSTDAGRHWTKSDRSYGRIVRFFVPRSETAMNGLVFAGTAEGVFRSDDRGRSWQDASEGLPWRNLVGFCGGTDGETGQVALYCTIPSKVVDGTLVGGIYCSRDLGQLWRPKMGQGLNLAIGKQDPYGFDEIPQYQFVAMAESHSRTVYVTTRGTGSRPPYHFTVYRSDDFGDSWRTCFTPGINVEPGWVPVDLNWNFGGPAIGFSVCPSNPDVVMFTNLAELYTTHDGGASWNCAYSRRVASEATVRSGQPWASAGLEVTGAWQFEFDPHDPRRTYICYTDIGFARSEDGGNTWRYSGRGSPWRNTWYRIAFDPLRPGVIYAACSNHHDIPHYRELDPARQLQAARRGGGVCISGDYGTSWRPLGQGLPDAPATSIAIDSRGNPDKRILYVTIFGHGVYKSTDFGKTWRKSSRGLGTAENMHVYSVRLHPDGTLFCSVTGKREGTEFAEGSGLYRSIDEGESWRLVSPPLKWAGDFDFNPGDSRTVYLTASTAPRHPQGGLYRTTDGGASWTQVVKEGDLPSELHRFIHAFFVAVHPRKPRTIYLSAFTHGLFISEDAGETWREVNGIPFTGVQRVTFDPKNDGIIWVTTHGGGVWKGPETGIQAVRR